MFEIRRYNVTRMKRAVMKLLYSVTISASVYDISAKSPRRIPVCPTRMYF